jgi:hypothetical protein
VLLKFTHISGTIRNTTNVLEISGGTLRNKHTNKTCYCGLSDVHNIISVQIKGTIPRINKKFVEYRSFKNFDQEFFLNDLGPKNLNSIVDKCDNVNSAYENFESEFISVIDKHAPMKKKKTCR